MTNIFIESISPDEKYLCIVESDDYSVWAYLHDIQQNNVIGEAPVCSIVELMELEKFKEFYKGQCAPPLVKGYADEKAIYPNMTNDRLDILWQVNGTSVLVTIDDEPFSMILNNEKLGYSKAIITDGPLGHPWDSHLYEEKKG